MIYETYNCKIFLFLLFQKNLINHSAIHDPDELKCRECKKVFRRLASLKSHLPIHEEDETVICDICQEEFVSVVSMFISLYENRVSIDIFNK